MGQTVRQKWQKRQRAREPDDHRPPTPPIPFIHQHQEAQRLWQRHLETKRKNSGSAGGALPPAAGDDDDDDCDDEDDFPDPPEDDAPGSSNSNVKKRSQKGDKNKEWTFINKHFPDIWGARQEFARARSVFNKLVNVASIVALHMQQCSSPSRQDSHSQWSYVSQLRHFLSQVVVR